MSKFDTTSKLIDQDKHPTMDNDDDNGVTRALFIDTDINTHFVLPVSSLFTVFSLKREVCLEHYKLFPEFGNIEVKSVLVKFNGNYYHLADSMLLKTVFLGMGDTWIVFVDVLTPDLPHNHLGHHQVEPSPDVPCEFKCIEPSSQQHDESKHVIPLSERDELQDMSCEEHKTRNNQMVTDDVSHIGLNIMVNDTSIFLKEQQLSEKTRGWNWAAQSTADHLNNPSEGHHHTSGVQPPPKFQKNDGENVFKNFKDGGNTNVSENLKKGGIDDIELPLGVQVKKSRKRKKGDTDTSAVSQSHAVTASQGTDIPELSSHPDPFNLERNIEENSAHFNSSNTGKKRKTNESEKESRNNNEKASPLHLNSALELLSSHHEPFNLTDKKKEIEEDVGPFKPGNTAKKIRNKKSKNSGIKNQGYDHNAEPEYTSRPEESVETMSIMLKETQSRGDVPEGPLGSPVKEQLNEANREMAPPMTIIQSDKRKKRRQKKEPVTVLDTSSLPVNQQLEEMNATEKVKQADAKTNEESLLVERQKETNEDVPSKSENTSRKKKNIKANGSGMDTQDSSRKREEDDQNGYNALNTREDLLFQDAVIRPEESVETMSAKVKKSSRSKKNLSAKDPSKSRVEEKPDDTARETATPISVVPSDKPKKGRKNKQHVLSQDLSSLPANQQHLGGKLMEMDAPKIGEQVEGNLANCDTNDTQLKSDTISNNRKTNDSEEESGKTAEVSAPHLNNVQKQLFEHEPLNLVEREKQIQEDDTSKSGRTARKKKNSKAKSSVIEIQELQSVRPEESAETMSGKLKKSQNRNDDLHKDPHDSPLKKQMDEETMELDAPINVIRSDESKKRKPKKQSVPSKDLRSVNLHVEEAKLEMVATRSVEQDDFMTNHDKDDEVDQNKVTHDGHQDELSEIPLQQVSSDLKHMKKSRASKHKAKELNQASSIDTLSSGHNLVKLKDIDGAKTKLHEHNESRPPLMESLVPQADPIKSGDVVASVNKASMVYGANFATETDSSKRVELADGLLTDSKSCDGQKGREMTQSEDDHVQFSQAPHLKVSSILPETSQLQKPRVSKKAQKLDLPSSIDMSSNGHNLVGSKKNTISTETSELQKSMTNQKHDKSIPPLSAKSSTIQKEAIDTHIPLADAAKAPRKNGVFSRSAGDRSESSEASSLSSGKTLFGIREKMNIKQPPKKMETMNTNHRSSSHISGKEAVNTPSQKKGLLASSEAIFDASSSSLDDDDRTDASSSSTTIAPDNSFSSDDSEWESKSVGKSKDDSSKGNGKSTYSSGFKLESVLRSSRDIGRRNW